MKKHVLSCKRKKSKHLLFILFVVWTLGVAVFVYAFRSFLYYNNKPEGIFKDGAVGVEAWTLFLSFLIFLGELFHGIVMIPFAHGIYVSAYPSFFSLARWCLDMDEWIRSFLLLGSISSRTFYFHHNFTFHLTFHFLSFPLLKKGSKSSFGSPTSSHISAANHICPFRPMPYRDPI